MKSLTRYFQRLMLGTLLVTTMSCEDFALGEKFLQKPPSSDVTIDTIFSTAVYARRVLWNSYGNLPYAFWSNNSYNYTTSMWYGILEGLTDLCNSALDWDGPNKAYYSGAYNAGSEEASDGAGGTKYGFTRRNSWQSIRMAWVFIENVDRVPDMDEAEKLRLKAEAKVVIATQYTEMLRHFGGLPIVDRAISAEDGLGMPARGTLQETVDFIVKEANNSRFPVYEEDIDNIVGVLHMRDVLYFAEQEEYLDRPISQIDGLLRSAHFAPEAKNINALFKEMQSEKIHMEIVIDEYGQTAGIVTMEDILEEIVGNIMDEYDNEEPDIVVKENGSFQLSGMTPLDDVEDALEMEFDEDDKDNFDTLNGFLISRLGHLPEDDEKGQVVFGGYRFSIVKAENKIIQTVAAERDAGPECEKENEE